MKPKIILMFCLLMTGKILFAQNNNDSVFTKYTEKQYNLMRKAYDDKDTLAYRIALDDFLAELNKTEKGKQKDYEILLRDAYYNFSCTYSLTGNIVKALDYLEKSKYYDYNHLLEDKDLDNIRNEKRFKAYLKYAKKNAPEDHLTTLKKAAIYNNDKSTIPLFLYQSPDNDSNLMKLRKIYNLDSIAGSGNDISQFINLMRWVHNLIPHNGSSGIPADRNALSMISTCKKENKTVNCRGLAIILNEVYLSMGYRSRFVTCLPKDSTDGDCHVINMVFSKSLQKWIWMDPTFEAYIMNEKGELLSIQEVRERLINGKPLILNPDANWNHRMTQTKEGYLYDYMAKNLYRLQCPIVSTFGYESKENTTIKKYCELIPIDYLDYIKNKKKEESSLLFRSEIISNPAIFWEKPE